MACARTPEQLYNWLISRATRLANGCLISHLKPNAKGYIYVSLDGKRVRANRFICERAVGPIGDLMALHTCDNRACIEKAHIYAGTAQDNSDDMVDRDRAAHLGRPPTNLHLLKEALELHESGYTLEQIANIQGLAGKSSARDRIRRAREWI